MLDAYARGTAYAGNATFFVQLHTGAPGAAGTSNVASNSTRVQSTFGAAASGGLISNTANVEWLNVPTSETYTHVSYWTAASAGTFLGDDDLNATAAMLVGDNFRIPTGDLDLAIT